MADILQFDINRVRGPKPQKPESLGDHVFTAYIYRGEEGQWNVTAESPGHELFPAIEFSEALYSLAITAHQDAYGELKQVSAQPIAFIRMFADHTQTQWDLTPDGLLDTPQDLRWYRGCLDDAYWTVAPHRGWRWHWFRFRRALFNLTRRIAPK